jgi:hypothetical protein
VGGRIIDRAKKMRRKKASSHPVDAAIGSLFGCGVCIMDSFSYPISWSKNKDIEIGLTQMDEIRGAGKATKEAYSYTLTEVQGPRNKEVRHLRKSYKRTKNLGLC